MKYTGELQRLLHKHYSSLLVPMKHLQAKNPEFMWLWVQALGVLLQ